MRLRYAYTEALLAGHNVPPLPNHRDSSLGRRVTLKPAYQWSNLARFDCQLQTETSVSRSVRPNCPTRPGHRLAHYVTSCYTKPAEHQARRLIQRKVSHVRRRKYRSRAALVQGSLERR